MSTIKIKHSKSFYIQVILFFALLISHTASAQLKEFQAMYFQNKYLGNPAMAGLEKGLIANIGYQGQWQEVPGNPKLMSATLEYNFRERVGIGLNLGSEEAGLITRTKILATYAYHLPIGGEDEKLNFGLSLGANFASVDYDKVIGNPDDPTLQNFNEGATLDGDFGIAYTSSLWTIQATLPNLNHLFFEDNDIVKEYVDRTTFYAAISYKIYTSSRINDFNLEPIFAYRAVKGYKDIFDIGARFNLPEYKFNVSTFYHTNQTISASFGIDLKQLGIFLSTSNYVGNTGAFANDSFELGLRYKFLE
ncbi:PorP/SprF family type IX secretion system membrane protein [Flavobacterium sp. N1736]|uniref:PorP/SprF family type IX secretion system membrane protein n=1 Tax=Flavobacterium sp. N1736 TaxID=2986823 RepID=UPI00222589AD|nr:PorP/SprF family type IX secretion system membrane protein [Flavobacterium sp. N1736]